MFLHRDCPLLDFCKKLINQLENFFSEGFR